MEEKKSKEQNPFELVHSNIIFGTSSYDIERGLMNEQFKDTSSAAGGDEDQIVNEQEQNEIVNPSEETFNEEPAPQTVTTDSTSVSQQKDGTIESAQKTIDIDPVKEIKENTGKISEAED